jgi:hypothetical protein
MLDWRDNDTAMPQHGVNVRPFLAWPRHMAIAQPHCTGPEDRIRREAGQISAPFNMAARRIHVSSQPDRLET